MVRWSWMKGESSTEVRGTEDGDWSKLAVWLGDPPQLLSALVSTSGTTLQVPIDPLCSGSGSFNKTIQLPEARPACGRDWEGARYDFEDLAENAEAARLQYLPHASKTWESSSGCSQGSDVLRGVLWDRFMKQAESFFNNDVLRVPVEQTSGTANIGLRAIAASWQGKQDYWWPLMIQSAPSLLQSLPILSYWVPGFPGSGFQYTYSAGAPYRVRPAYLVIGPREFRPSVGAFSQMLTLPLSKNGALTLDKMTLELNLHNHSGQGATSISLIPEGTKAVLDSASPFLELPKDVCFNIAEELDLQYDEQTGLFGMDELILSRLESVRPSLRFGLGHLTYPGGLRSPEAEVVLPFEALKHMHTPPVSEHTRRGKPYFPIRVAEEDRGIVLGRTIFQEIELSVDYDRKEFYVFAADGGVQDYGPPFEIGIGHPKDFTPFLTPLLSRTLVGFVVLFALLLLPSLKMAYNMQERHHRRLKLERSWVQSHTVSIAAEELSRYANAVVKRAGRDTNASKGHASGASVVLRLAKRSSQSVHVAVSWLVHRNVSGEGAIRLSESDEEQEEVARRRQTAHERRRHAIDEQQEQLRNAWRRGKRMGHWFYQRLLKPAVAYTIVKPLEWTIRFADFSANTSQRLALERQRQGEIYLE